MKKVTIFHGYDATGRMVFLDRLPELMVEQYTYKTEAELNGVFRENNAVDGTEVNVQNEARSLSVGDVIKYGRKFFLICSFGCVELPNLKQFQMVSKSEIKELWERTV